MQRFNTDFEMLSAYLDGELSQSDKKYIEEKIKTSLELQNELSKLKKLKSLTSASMDRISDSPYFETRVLASLNQESKSGFNFRKWVPVAAIVMVTLGLMVLLKFNPRLIDKLIQEQKENIAGFYKENLQPLLYAANLTNDDIFNFALYQQLPLDSANQQILRLGYDPNGTQYFEIKNLSDLTESRPAVNLKNFVELLDLNEIETKQIDSIINSYSEQISSLVLVNENRAVAINPNIWNTRSAILADILAFAKTHSAKNLDKLIPNQSLKLDNESLASWVNVAKNNTADQYIFYTPDSVFKESFKFDMDEFKENMKRMEVELKKMDKEINNYKNFTVFIDTNSITNKTKLKRSHQFKVLSDSNFVKVTIQNLNIPDFTVPDVRLPNFDSIAVIIEEATKNIVTVRPPIPPDPYSKKNFKYDYNTKNKTHKKRTEINLDSLMNLKNIIIDSVQNELLKNLDNSQPNNLKLFFNDSLMYYQNNELKKEMDNLKKELRRFREEIKNLDRDQNGSDKREIKADTIRII